MLEFHLRSGPITFAYMENNINEILCPEVSIGESFADVVVILVDAEPFDSLLRQWAARCGRVTGFLFLFLGTASHFLRTASLEAAAVDLAVGHTQKLGASMGGYLFVPHPLEDIKQVKLDPAMHDELLVYKYFGMKWYMHQHV